MSEPRQEWRDTAYVAVLFGKSRTRIQRWVKDGKFKTARKVGDTWFIHDSELRPEYDAEREGPQRGDAIPPEPGQPVGGDGDDAERETPFSVSRVQERRRDDAPGAVEAAGRRGGSGSATTPRWTVPADVAS